VVALLDATVQRLTSSTVVVGLVAPAVPCIVDYGDENPSLLGTASMAPLASFPSRRRRRASLARTGPWWQAIPVRKLPSAMAATFFFLFLFSKKEEKKERK
jgi:hypothetical protein